MHVCRVISILVMLYCMYIIEKSFIKCHYKVVLVIIELKNSFLLMQDFDEGNDQIYFLDTVML